MRTKLMKTLGWALLIVVGVMGAIMYFLAVNRPQTSSQSQVPIMVTDTEKYSFEITEVAQDLDVPWDIAVSSGGDLFITERRGQVKVLETNGTIRTIATLSQVVSVGESGLTGLALHPRFSSNNRIYLYYTYRSNGQIFNRISQFIYQDKQLSGETVVLDQLPGGTIHNGGRMRFGPDGKLWILTGDGANPSNASSSSSLGGKVLRMNEDGSIPEDNPTKDSLVYSLGHRNPQGLDFHPVTGDLVVTEHGESAFDEINIIKPGGNYGWPEVRRCVSSDNRYINPILCSENETWAPSGGAFLSSQISAFKNSFFFAGLRSELLQRIDIVDGKVTDRETIIQKSYGRLRAVTADGQGNLYVSTSNRDGRGFPQEGDDKILKLTPKRAS